MDAGVVPSGLQETSVPPDGSSVPLLFTPMPSIFILFVYPEKQSRLYSLALFKTGLGRPAPHSKVTSLSLPEPPLLICKTGITIPCPRECAFRNNFPLAEKFLVSPCGGPNTPCLTPAVHLFGSTPQETSKGRYIFEDCGF